MAKKDVISVKGKRGRPAQRALTILVDAGALGEQDERNAGGVFTVVSHLLERLAVLDKKNTYILLSFSNIPKFQMEKFPGMRNIVLPSWGWLRFWMPLAMRFFKADIFLALSQAMPQINVPTVGVIYDIVFEYFPRGYPDSYKRLSQNTRFLVTHARSFITISRHVQEDVVRYFGISPQKVSVYHPGVDSQFNPEGPRFIDAQSYILYVGALKPTKNIPFLISAFGTFLQTNPVSCRLILIGSDKEMDPAILKTIADLKLEDKVIIKGYVSQSDLPAYYRGAQCVVIPSRFEGFGLPALEAIASGAPVIASKIPSLEEILGVSALYVDYEKEQELVEAFHYMMTDVEGRDQLIKKGLSRARDFSWDMFAKGFIAEIKKAIV